MPTVLAVMGLAGVVLGCISSAVAMSVSIRNGRKINEVHVLVNSQLTAVLTRVAQLTDTLKAADVPVPDVENPSALP